MGAGITYMGTKQALVANVVEVARSAQHGTLLDVFSGMCAVGSAVSKDRQVWNNDIQRFAAEVARALFLSRTDPLTALNLADICYKTYAQQCERLKAAFELSLKCEAQLLQSKSFSAFARNQIEFLKRYRGEAGHCRLRSHSLFARTYSGTYFGLQQAIEIDSIVRALDFSFSLGTISKDEQRWALVSLGRALLKTSNSTGHFAQYLKPNERTFRRYIKLRSRSVWSEWLNSEAVVSPIRDLAWRKGNRVYNNDSLVLLKNLSKKNTEVSAIYADPPYTDDQYSRYYHLFETLLLYDYPSVSGAGLYRSGRFQTPFSLRSKVGEAMTSLVRYSAKTGADLILSYPANGLAVLAGLDVRALLKRHYRCVEISKSVSHQHSTFGASKGAAKTHATELIYLARA